MSYLIIGGTKEERRDKALKISNDEFMISNFDTILVEGETSIGIDQIRNLEHQLKYKPYNSPCKAAIIHPGEILSAEAQNALLKTLEEAGENSLLILTAPQTEALLPTVVSRCQIIRLPTKSEIILSQEEFRSIFNFQFSIFNARVGERLKIASKIGKEKEEIKIWLEKQIFFWREILLINESHGEVRPGTRSDLGEKLKDYITTAQIIKIIRDLEKTRNLIEQNVNPRLALENFLLDLPSLKVNML